MTNLPPIKIPPSDNSKAAGIRGLKQILESAITSTYQERSDLLSHYLTKFENRMQKAKTPLTHGERMELISSLLEIINKNPEEIEEGCRCKYQSIRKGYCVYSYTNKCDECKNNQLLNEKTDSFLEV